MSESCVWYKKRRRCKYTLAEDVPLQLDIRPENEIDTPFIVLTADGLLTVRKGYAWDGPSGPSIDTKTFMRRSLVHDVLYQLMREEYLPLEHREYADGLLRTMCREDGMSRVRAAYVYWSVRRNGESSATPRADWLRAPE